MMNKKNKMLKDWKSLSLFLFFIIIMYYSLKPSPSPYSIHQRLEILQKNST